MRPHAAHAPSRLILLPTLARSGPKADADVLPSCLLLAVLLHVWLALMIGDRISPNALGQSGWGSLTVTLLGQSGRSPDGDAQAAAQNWRDDGPIGQAKSPRYGGQLRREAPPPDSGPGAENLGRWKQQEVKPDPSRSEQDLPEASSPGVHDLPPKPQTPEPQPMPQPMPAPAMPPPLPATQPQPSPETTVLSLPQESAPRLRRQEAVQAIKPPAAANPALQPLPELPNIAPTAEPTPEPTPIPTLKTLDAPPTQRPSTRLEPLSAARPSGALERLAPVPLSALPRELPRELPTLPEPLPVPKPEPVPSPPAASPPEPAPAQAPAPNPTPNPTPSPASTTPTPSPAPVTRGDPLANPLLSPRSSPGAPDAGARVGHDIATPPSASASAPPPPLHLSLPRSGVSAARRGPGMLELLPGLPERKTKMEKAVEEANREDCRKAHSEAGLLAAVPLAIDSARGKGCKW